MDFLSGDAEMMFDSDILIWCLRGDPAAGRVVNAELERSISAVSLMKLLQGSASRAELKKAKDLVRELEMRVLPVTEAISYRALALIEIRAPADRLRLGGALVAATALENDETLITGNPDQFTPIPGLKIKPFRHSLSKR
jgi:predicted nucleic acid-binding protein